MGRWCDWVFCGGWWAGGEVVGSVTGGGEVICGGDGEVGEMLVACGGGCGGGEGGWGVVYCGRGERADGEMRWIV